MYGHLEPTCVLPLLQIEQASTLSHTKKLVMERTAHHDLETYEEEFEAEAELKFIVLDAEMENSAFRDAPEEEVQEEVRA